MMRWLCCILLLVIGCQRSSESVALDVVADVEVVEEEVFVLEEAVDSLRKSRRRLSEVARVDNRLSSQKIPGIRDLPALRIPLVRPQLLLTMEDLVSRAPTQSFVEGKFPGFVEGPDSLALLFSNKKDSQFAAGIQIYRSLDAKSLRERMEKMQASWPSSTPLKGFADKAFFSRWGEVSSVVFDHPGRKLAIAVSCHATICSPDDLYALAKTVYSRVP